MSTPKDPECKNEKGRGSASVLGRQNGLVHIGSGKEIRNLSTRKDASRVSNKLRTWNKSVCGQESSGCIEQQLSHFFIDSFRN